MDEALMSDETNNEADAPLAEGLDATWWKSAGGNVDAAEQEKAAVQAKDYEAERIARYLESGGADQIGGWLGSGSCSGRDIYRQRGRMWDWR
jgi:hypothetical protein